MKISTSSFLICIGLVTMLSSCHYYLTVPIINITKGSIENSLSEHKILTIQMDKGSSSTLSAIHGDTMTIQMNNQSNSPKSIVRNDTIVNDTLFGVLSKIMSPYPSPDVARIPRYKYPNALNYTNLYVNFPLNSDSIAIPLSQITTGTFHTASSVWAKTEMYTQNQTKIRTVFVRVYDLNGKNIGRGKVRSITDTSVVLSGNAYGTHNIQLSNIGKVKTKRSGLSIFFATVAGTAVLTGAAIQITTQGGGYGLLGGAIGGAVIGGILSGINNPKSYYVNGDAKKWKEFQTALRLFYGVGFY